MSNRTQRIIAGFVVLAAALAPVVLFAQPASAFPPGDPLYHFKYKIVATTFIKRANLTLTTPPGIFIGAIDLKTGQLNGNIALPPVTFTQSEAGIGLVTSTSATVPTKPVTGHVNLKTLQVTSTSSFNIHIVTMYPATPPLPLPLPVPPVNLVGDSCTTVSPISVTMSGKASLGSPSTFNGVFTIPDFQNCQAMTTVINQQIPGPDNTFSATATPA